MVWALDQKQQSAANTSDVSHAVPDITQAQSDNAKQMSNDQAAKISCVSTDCNVDCLPGTNQVAQMRGQPGQLSTR